MESLQPKLRFPEFEGDWKSIKLDEIAKKINSGKTPLGGESVYTEKGIHFIRSQNVLDSKLSFDNLTYIDETTNNTMKNSIVLPNDILLNITGASLGRSCVVPASFTVGNVNQHVCIIRLNDKNNPNFIQPILASEDGQIRLKNLSTGSGREGLNFQSIKGLEITKPSLSEQTKIANFLSAVDEKLNLLKVKKAALEDYKKGMMQKIFSQEIRFKDENGKDFAKWVKVDLKDIFDYKKGSGLSKDKLDIKGENSCILYGELYTKYNEVIFNVISKTNSNEGLQSIKGDLLIPSSTTTSGIDLANVTALNYDNVLLGGDITVLRSNQNVSSIFYAYYLSNHKKEEIASYAQGITIVHLYYNHIKDMIIDFPCLEEQIKIASFLSAIDEKIEMVATQIVETQEYKKGLLQQLFC